MIDICCENCTKHVNRVRGKMRGFLVLQQVVHLVTGRLKRLTCRNRVIDVEAETGIF